MKPLLRRARSSSFLRNNLVYFVGSFGISVLNYLYYPLLGRLMPPAQFGEVQTIMAFFLQTSIFLQVLGMVSIGVIARYQSSEDRNRIIAEYSRLAFYIALLTCGLTIVLSPLLQDFFQFGSVWPFMAFGIVVLVSVPLAFTNSFLQAREQFGDLARSGNIAAGGKLILAVGLVLLELQAFGAIVAIAIAQLMALAYTLRRSMGSAAILATGLRLKRLDFSAMKVELPFAGLVLVASLTVNILLGLDIIVIKHYFDPHVAGLYAGISTIARVIFYVTGPMAMVMIAAIKPDQPGLNRQYLLRSAALSLLTGGGCLIVFTVVPQLVIGMLLGSTYLVYADLLPRLSLAIFTMAAANLLVYYYVASRLYVAAIIAPVCLLIGLILIAVDHRTPIAIISHITITGTLLTGALVVGLFHYRGSRA